MLTTPKSLIESTLDQRRQIKTIKVVLRRQNYKKSKRNKTENIWKSQKTNERKLKIYGNHLFN